LGPGRQGPNFPKQSTLGFLTSPTSKKSIEGEKKGEFFQAIKVSHCLFLFFTENLQNFLTFVHAIFPDSACNNNPRKICKPRQLGKGQQAMSHSPKNVTIKWYQWASGNRMWQMKNSGACVPSIDLCHGEQNTTIS
jgi:hypothetical protein